MKMADWCGHTWLIFGLWGRTLRVLGSQSWCGIRNIDQVFCEFLPCCEIRQHPQGSCHLKHNPLVPPLLQCQGGGTVYLKCSCVLPVTGPLMLVTAVGSEQKAVYFRSRHPSSFSDTHTQREKEPVGDLRKLLVFTVEAFINYGFQSKN